MHPILFEYNGIIITSFGVLLTVSFIVFMLALVKFTIKNNVTMDFFSSHLISLFLAVILGAKGLYWLCNYDILWTYITASFSQGEYLYILKYLFNIEQFYVLGGLLTGGLLFYYFIRKNNQPLLQWLDALLPSLHGALIFGFLGSFLGGYYVGKPSPSFPGMVFAGDPNYSFAAANYIVPIHPIQLYSMLCSTIIFFILLEIGKKVKVEGAVGALGIFLLSIQIILIEFLRGSDNIPYLLGFTLNQYVGIAGVVLSLYLFMKKVPRIST